MIITNSMGYLINSKEVYVHDDTLQQVVFNRCNRTLELFISKHNNEESSTYVIKFAKTVGFEMTSCNYWGESSHILDFEYLERTHNVLLPRLYSRNCGEFAPFCELSSDKDYIETLMTFSSGDQLRIVCEYIIIAE